MSLKIAIAGKGGTGKTTVAALLTRSLINQKLKPLLAVDADPNSCLAEALGLAPTVEKSIGAIREELRAAPDDKPAGIPKNEWLEHLLNEAVIESTGFDLLVMGRQEGPACYCAINHLLRQYLEKIASQYNAVIIDNEAGLEHLSRRSNGSLDIMLIVCLPTIAGARTAARIIELARSLDLAIGHSFLVLNQANGELRPELAALFQRAGAEIIAAIPIDPAVEEFEINEQSLLNLPADAPAAVAVDELATKLLKSEK